MYSRVGQARIPQGQLAQDLSRKSRRLHLFRTQSRQSEAISHSPTTVVL
jgi:hypothetical protein